MMLLRRLKPRGRTYVAPDLDELRRQRRAPTIENVFEVLDLLERHGIGVWLHGGWAVESLLGIPLSHQDVDLLVSAADEEKVRELVGDRAVQETNGILVCCFHQVQVDFSFFYPYHGSRAYVAHAGLIWVFPDPRTHGWQGTLAGRSVPIIHPAHLVAAQEHTVRKKKKALAKMLERARMLREKLAPEELAHSRQFWPHPYTWWNEWRLRLRLL
jgi:hypothetical protein